MKSSRVVAFSLPRPVLATTVMALLSACSPAGLLNATAPRDGIETVRDLRYGTGPRHRLDVYTPRGAHGAPVVVFFYGGGWVEGDKAQYGFVARALAARGIVTIIPDYRLYPETRFPGFIEDAAVATRWAHDHARSFGGDPRRLVVMGHSAGAYLAAMLTLDQRYLGAVGLAPRADLAGAIGLAGPYDFLPLGTDELRAIFAAPGDMASTQPISFARGDNPPLLLLTGSRDDTVHPRNTVSLAAAIRAQGGWVETIVYPRLGHRLILGAIARPLRGLAPVLDDITGFVLSRRTAPDKTTAGQFAAAGRERP